MLHTLRIFSHLVYNASVTVLEKTKLEIQFKCCKILHAVAVPTFSYFPRIHKKRAGAIIQVRNRQGRGKGYVFFKSIGLRDG